MRFIVYLFLLVSLSTCLVASEFLPPGFHADFEQVTVSIVTGKEQVSSGVIDYQYPSNLRLKIEKPDPLLLVSNGQKTWFYRPPFMEGEREELTVKDSGKSEVTQFFDILKNGLVNNQWYQVEKKQTQVHLLFSKSAKEKIGLEKAEISFKSAEQVFGHISSIVVVPSNKKKFELRFSTMELAPVFPKNHFVFSKP